MKKISITLITSLFILSPFTKANNSLAPIEQVNCIDFDLGALDIYYYLVGLGYTVYGIPVQSGNNWTVRTSYGTMQYMTTVFTDGTSITGHEDIAI